MKVGMVTGCYKPVINGVTRMVSLYKEKLEAAGDHVTVFTLGEPDPSGEDSNVIRSPAIPIGDTGYYFSYDLYTGNYAPLPQPAADAVMRQIWPEFTDYCDVVITPSESVKKVMRDFGVRRRIVVIPNGIELDPFWHPPAPRQRTDFGIPKEATLLVYTGRLASEKNLHKLLPQFALAQEIVSSLHLLLVGRGPQEEKLKRQAGELQVAEQVHFAGSVPYEEVGNVLAIADAYVTASVSEVHPLSVIEGMAAGLPVAAVSSPGISDTLEPGNTGLLTSKPDGLAAAIVGLVIDSERRQQMGKAAKEASERYDIAHTVQETQSLYQELRETRPDLQREREHGRWMRATVPPLLERLAQLISPAE